MKYDKSYSAKFRRDYRRAMKQGKNMELLEKTIDLLAGGKKLSPEYRDHPLKGTYLGYRECHIEPDWLLIYRIEKDVLVLLLSRTGTHSELLDE
jgi:mRNA interferase YafQ